MLLRKEHQTYNLVVAMLENHMKNEKTGTLYGDIVVAVKLLGQNMCVIVKLWCRLLVIQIHLSPVGIELINK